DDVSENLDRAGKRLLRAARRRFRDGNQARHGAAPLQDGDRLPRAIDVVEHGETLGLELGRLERAHVTTLTGHKRQRNRRPFRIALWGLALIVLTPLIPAQRLRASVWISRRV